MSGSDGLMMQEVFMKRTIFTLYFEVFERKTTFASGDYQAIPFRPYDIIKPYCRANS